MIESSTRSFVEGFPMDDMIWNLNKTSWGYIEVVIDSNEGWDYAIYLGIIHYYCTCALHDSSLF